MMDAIEALAESWASIDGNLEPFRTERDSGMTHHDPGYTGHYDGYMVEAAEMIQRLRARGYDVTPTAPAPSPYPA